MYSKGGLKMHRKNSLIYIMRFAGKEYYLDMIRMKLYVNDQKSPFDLISGRLV